MMYLSNAQVDSIVATIDRVTYSARALDAHRIRRLQEACAAVELTTRCPIPWNTIGEPRDQFRSKFQTAAVNSLGMINEHALLDIDRTIELIYQIFSVRLGLIRRPLANRHITDLITCASVDPNMPGKFHKPWAAISELPADSLTYIDPNRHSSTDFDPMALAQDIDQLVKQTDIKSYADRQSIRELGAALILNMRLEVPNEDRGPAAVFRGRCEHDTLLLIDSTANHRVIDRSRVLDLVYRIWRIRFNMRNKVGSVETLRLLLHCCKSNPNIEDGYRDVFEFCVTPTYKVSQ